MTEEAPVQTPDLRVMDLARRAEQQARNAEAAARTCWHGDDDEWAKLAEDRAALAAALRMDARAMRLCAAAYASLDASKTLKPATGNGLPLPAPDAGAAPGTPPRNQP